MYVTNITDDFDNMSLCNCTDEENNIDTIIPALLFITPCDIVCLISLMVYTLIIPLMRKK